MIKYDVNDRLHKEHVTLADVPEADPTVFAHLVDCSAFRRGYLQLDNANADTVSVDVEVWGVDEEGDTPYLLESFTVTDFTVPTLRALDLVGYEGVGVIITAMTDDGGGSSAVTRKLKLTNVTSC